MILIDSNIPMYLVGSAHPNKEIARRQVEEAITRGESFCSDVEVLQEILHRYMAIRRPEGIDPALAALLGLVDVVFPIELADVERARRVLRSAPGLSARDAIHVAVMLGRDIDRILTFDTGFDGIPGILRVA